EQVPDLAQAMIRNNKADVTDLAGHKLFKPVTAKERTYVYSETEQAFYDTMSGFIADGRAYSRTLEGRDQTATILVLITLQKLAASSLAAIRTALRRRRDVLMALSDEERKSSKTSAKPEGDSESEWEEDVPV